MNAAPDTVVLLHGLGRSASSMEPLGRSLAAAGYEVINPDYPSTSADVASLAEATVGAAVEKAKGARVHFVTHSMGGILVRAWCAAQKSDRMGASSC